MRKGQLRAVHLKAIVQVYEGHEKEVLDLLRKNPVKAVPIIMARLEQKGQEWRQNRLQLRESWKETYDKCFYKALDYRQVPEEKTQIQCNATTTHTKSISHLIRSRCADIHIHVTTWCVGVQNKY